MGYAGEAMNELHGTDVFTEESRVIDGGNVYERKGDHLDIKIGGANKIPRRARLELNTPAELAIRTAVDMVESIGASPTLTDAVILLGQARDKVADFVDGTPQPDDKLKPRPLTLLGEVADELQRARATHAPMNGHHEGYAVILEELDELWEECRVNTHPRGAQIHTGVTVEMLRAQKRAAMRKEALQVAAMAVRFIEDVCDKK